MSVKYKITFQSPKQYNKPFYSVEKTFNDENHKENFVKKCQEKGSKIVDIQRIYEDYKFSIEDLKKAFDSGRTRMNTPDYFPNFDVWFDDYFKIS